MDGWNFLIYSGSDLSLDQLSQHERNKQAKARREMDICSVLSRIWVKKFDRGAL